jgi:hypothetical protein
MSSPCNQGFFVQNSENIAKTRKITGVRQLEGVYTGASMAGIGDKSLFDKELKLDRQTTEGG